jgi:tetratricopeptide (TPR) repeat protein
LSERVLEKLLPSPYADKRMVASLTNLALALQALSKPSSATLLLEDALAITQRVQPYDHLGMAMALSNLARVLPDVGDRERALSLLEDALAITEKTLGSDHSNVATNLSNIAGILVGMGEATKARSLLERALVIAEKAPGAGHPSMANILSTLAMALRDLGEAGQARPLLERAVAIKEKTYGRNHPEVAKSLSKLAGVLRDLGEADQARLLLERTLAIHEKSYAASHPDVTKSRSKLAAVLRDLGRVKEAHALTDPARAAELGGHTSGTIGTLGDSAWEGAEEALKDEPHDEARLGEALKLQVEHNLTIAERIFGPDHLVVARCLSMVARYGVGICFSGSTSSCKRCALLERSLAIIEAAYGPEHPDVAASMVELANALYVRVSQPDDKNRSRRLLGQSYAIFENTYETTPWGEYSMNSMLFLALYLGELQVAERVLVVMEQRYGHNHDSLGCRRYDLEEAKRKRDVGIVREP